MTKIGIDFSLNSPSICVEHNGKIEFASFFNDFGEVWKKDKPLKKFIYHNKLENVVYLYPYTRTPNGDTYQEEQKNKMHDALMISNMIMGFLSKYGDDVIISLEGFAYQSSGASFIDLILFNTFLRRAIIEKYGDKLQVFSPSAAKKLAGKGNFKKEDMINAFTGNVLSDTILEKTELFKFMKSEDLDFKNIKPIDDLVDSYFLMKCIETL